MPTTVINNTIIGHPILKIENNNFIFNEKIFWCFDRYGTGFYVLDKSNSKIVTKFLEQKSLSYEEQIILKQIGIIEDSNLQVEIEDSDYFEIWIQAVNHCNLACMGCTTGMDVRQDKRNKLEIQNAGIYLEKIFKDGKIKGFSKAKLKLGGGEPTLAGLNWIKDLVEIAKDTGKKLDLEIEIILLSNGIAITDNLIDLMEKENIRYSISLDPERTIPTTELKTINVVIKNLEKLSKRKINGNAQFTVYKDNLHLLPQIYEIVSDLGINISFSLFRPQNTEQKKYNRAKDIIYGMNIFFQTVYKRIIDKKFYGQLFSFDYMDLSGYKDAVCGSGDSYIVLDYNGDIYTCHESIKFGIPLTNCSSKENVFDSIKNKFEVQNYRVNTNIIGESLYDNQGGKGCPWVRRAENGDYKHASKNTQRIYNYIGSMYLSLIATSA